MKKLFIATSTFSELSNEKINLFKKKGILVIKNPLKRKLDKKNLLKLAKDTDYIIAGTEEYNREVLSKMHNLKILYRLGSGINNLDINYIKTNNIKLNVSKITPEISVAELILGYILVLLRKIHVSDYEMKNKIWNKKMGSNLHGKTIGIIGYGKIGKYLSKLIKAFGAKVIINDIKLQKNKKNSLNYLLKNSDIVSINVSVNKSKKILNKAKLNLLKKNSLLINTSRPEVLDYNHLYNLLKKKKINGAALDVFEVEPYYGKFCGLKNALLTPHIGGYSKEIRSKMEIEALNLFENL